MTYYTSGAAVSACASMRHRAVTTWRPNSQIWDRFEGSRTCRTSSTKPRRPPPSVSSKFFFTCKAYIGLILTF